ncbi:MAG: hypothetical protein IPK96_02825 [Flammeovirgaceae bacterium]|jgi:hypothetical protein|nr:hypothetical protein [Flammeovirgaceae bacterium]
MKLKYIIPLFLLFALGTISSCDLLGNADDVSFEAELPLAFTVDEQADNPSGKSYTDSQLLNASSDPDVAKYASKIKEFKVNRITYRISGATDPLVSFTNGTLKLASGKTIATVSSVSLSNTAELELNADTAGFNELASALLSDKQEMVQLQGTLSKTPIKFYVDFTFYTTITANAL